MAYEIYACRKTCEKIACLLSTCFGSCLLMSRRPNGAHSEQEKENFLTTTSTTYLQGSRDKNCSLRLTLSTSLWHGLYLLLCWFARLVAIRDASLRDPVFWLPVFAAEN